MTVVEIGNPPSEEPPAPPAAPPESDRRRLTRLKVIFPFLLVLVFVTWAFMSNYIPSDSMLPTLRPGDHILAMRSWLAYPRGRMPERGDIVLFHPPDRLVDDPGPAWSMMAHEPRPTRADIWIKRVVGLPGETVQIRGGKVIVNGSELRPGYYRTPPNIAEEMSYPYAVWQPVRLGPDELFVLGDNANESDDSRFWGPLSRDKVIARFVRVLYHEEGGINAKRAEAEKEGANGAP